MSKSAAHIIVRGRVQGVFFRASARTEANKLRLSGWVRNRDDGSVEVYAEGGEEEARHLVEWCRKGPPAAVVTGVDVDWVSPEGMMKGFVIR
ncbi:MAG: acylphosphatase [Nitrospinales bacterium]